MTVAAIAEGHVTKEELEHSSHADLHDTMRAESASPSFGDYSEEESDASSDLEVN